MYETGDAGGSVGRGDDGGSASETWARARAWAHERERERERDLAALLSQSHLR